MSQNQFILRFTLALFASFATAFAAPSAPKARGAKLETVRLAAGCFWGTEEFFRKIPGVVSTRVGYEGGTKANPSYENVSSGNTGHAETAEIVYDPKVVKLDALLIQFFKMHDPTTPNRQGNDHGTQYRSAIFVESAEQKVTAEKIKAKVEKSGAWKAKIATTIEPAGKFFPAEENHQKYLVKHPGGYDNHYLRPLNFK